MFILKGGGGKLRLNYHTSIRKVTFKITTVIMLFCDVKFTRKFFNNTGTGMLKMIEELNFK